MKCFKLLVLAVSIALAAISQSSGYSVEVLQEQQLPSTSLAWQEVVDYAQNNLPLEGQLLAKSDGFVYLKVDDGYIHTLFPMLGLAKKGFKEPPYFRSNDSPGAHISLFYVDEKVLPEEIGQTFHFKLKDIIIVHPSKHAYYAILEVEAPELEKLREKYGLSSKLKGHEFHISIAKKTIRSSKSS